MQTTAIDEAAHIVKLTTLLAHSSGEWIASDWPVCAVAETATPRRMGAALTYARRYALFTLVGIAGEDDLDAPDLQAPTSQTATPGKQSGIGNGHLNGRRAAPARKPALGPEKSATLYARLLASLSELGTTDEAALWAKRSLTEKDKLIPADAERLEGAFASKLAAFAAADPDQSARSLGESRDTASQEPGETCPRPDRTQRQLAPGTNPSLPEEPRQRSKPTEPGIDKSVLTLAEPRRLRDRNHLKHVAKQPCLVCGRAPSDPHHLRFAQNSALGRKVSDEFTVPLCRGHHREVHRGGDEAAWWNAAAINPIATARALWLETHPHLSRHPPFPTGEDVRSKRVDPTMPSR